MVDSSDTGDQTAAAGPTPRPGTNGDGLGLTGRVGNVFVFAREFDQAVEWYERVLGAEAQHPLSQLALWDFASTRLTLHREDTYNTQAPADAGTVPYFDVADADAAADHWTAHGGTVHRGPKTVFSGERLVQLEDPFGNLIGLRMVPKAPIDVTRDVLYSPEHGLTLDIYRSSERSNGATVIDIHGGGWFRGDKAKDADWAEELAAAGYLVVVPNYREAPGDHFPAPLEDMSAVWEWLGASDYPISHDRIGVVGSSAGGNMAVGMGIRYGIPVVSLSGILDIASWIEDHHAVVPEPDESQDFSGASAAINQGGLNDPFYKWFILNYLFGDPRRTPHPNSGEPMAAQQRDVLEAATPAFRVTPSTGPMYLANSLQEFVPTSGIFDLSSALASAGVAHTTRFLPGSRHAKGYLADVRKDVLEFLDRYLTTDERG